MKNVRANERRSGQKVSFSRIVSKICRIFQIVTKLICRIFDQSIERPLDAAELYIALEK